MPLSPETILQQRYRIVRTIGSGGMGTVYLAKDLRLGERLCAVKEHRPDPSLDPVDLAKLRSQFEQREAGILAALDHPNLPRVFDYFTEGGNDYLAMDYVAGDNLHTELARYLKDHGRPLPEKVVLLWADQVLDALHYLHTRPTGAIIHRDIKPANIILTDAGRIKLVDFGLAKLVAPAQGSAHSQSMRMATLDYAPLEQFSPALGHTDERSDVFAVGATLYHLLTGAPPPAAVDRAAGVAAMVSARERTTELSASTCDALDRAMALRKEERFASVADLRRELRNVQPTQRINNRVAPTDLDSAVRRPYVAQLNRASPTLHADAIPTFELQVPSRDNTRSKPKTSAHKRTDRLMLGWFIATGVVSVVVVTASVMLDTNALGGARSDQGDGQSSEVSVQEIPQPPNGEASSPSLSVLASKVEYKVSETELAINLQLNDSVALQPGANILIGENGHGALAWANFLRNDLYSGADLLISMSIPERRKAILDQASGTARYQLAGDGAAEVKVVANWIEVKVDTGKADFVVSYVPSADSTVWVVSLEGSATVYRKGQSVTLNTGEAAAFNADGDLPKPLVIDGTEVQSWLSMLGDGTATTSIANVAFRCEVKSDDAVFRAAPAEDAETGEAISAGSLVSITERDDTASWLKVLLLDGSDDGWLPAVALGCLAPPAAAPNSDQDGPAMTAGSDVVQVVVVKPGDTLGSIAARVGVDPTAVRNDDGDQVTEVVPGDLVYIVIGALNTSEATADDASNDAANGRPNFPPLGSGPIPRQETESVH